MGSDFGMICENEILRKIIEKIEYPLGICEYCNTFITIKLDEKNALRWHKKIGKEEFSDANLMTVDIKTIKKAIKNNIEFDVIRVYDKKYDIWCDVERKSDKNGRQ
ncbi:MAG: hypothetical protein N2114_06450 [Candidatus Goldbacteria bacterium]|nr:hypothetical protein [Candidatus Goldiibacteriota bacterium]